MTNAGNRLDYEFTWTLLISPSRISCGIYFMSIWRRTTVLQISISVFNTTNKKDNPTTIPCGFCDLVFPVQRLYMVHSPGQGDTQEIPQAKLIPGSSLQHGLTLIGSHLWCWHDMETLSALLALGEGNPPVIHQWLEDFPHKGQVMQSFEAFLVVSLSELLKTLSCQWFETPQCSCIMPC